MIRALAYWLHRQWLHYLLRTVAYRRAELGRIVIREHAHLDEEEIAINERLRALQTASLTARLAKVSA